jgi:hypothetical protein
VSLGRRLSARPDTPDHDGRPDLHRVRRQVRAADAAGQDPRAMRTCGGPVADPPLAGISPPDRAACRSRWAVGWCFGERRYGQALPVQGQVSGR